MYVKNSIPFLCDFYEKPSGCLPGYYGNDCTSKCEHPSYGDQCQDICICDFTSCHHVTGCLAGNFRIFISSVHVIFSKHEISNAHIAVCQFLLFRL